MIQGLHHIAIIASSEASIEFYKQLGFSVIDRIDRGYDIIVMMSGACSLEIFIDKTHPARLDLPEAMGLRHIALKVDNIESTLNELGLDLELIKTAFDGKRFAFFKDPDGLPIELHE